MAGKFFGRLVEGLTKTRKTIATGFNTVFSSFTSIDEDFYEEIEEMLIMSDIGVMNTENIIDELRNEVEYNHISDPEECRAILKKNIASQMDLGENAFDFENKKSVVLVIGVNGVGKTTSIGKLACQLKNDGKKVMMAACDTFRAGASEQLKVWANRSETDIIAGADGADPGSVLFDAIQSAKSKNCGG